MSRHEPTGRGVTVALAVLACIGCEKQKAQPAQPPRTVAAQTAPPARHVDEPPPAVDPAKPDYEDAVGTVIERIGKLMIEVEGGKPICLPFEAPAEARTPGASVRFTLYLSGELQGQCRVVQTLVSMRAVSSPRTTP